MICDPSHKHGETGTCYNSHRCRCEECKQSRADYQFYRENLLRVGKWDRARLEEGTGVRRRMQALSFMGWPSTVLGELLGTTQAQAHKLLTCETVTPGTGKRVRVLYDRLWTQVPPGGRRVYTVNRARRYGWVGPLAWDDETIDNPDAVPVVDADPFDVDDTSVEAAVRGELVELNPSERREAIVRLTSSGWSTSRTATQLGCSERTVTRIRTELGLTPGRVAA